MCKEFKLMQRESNCDCQSLRSDSGEFIVRCIGGAWSTMQTNSVLLNCALKIIKIRFMVFMFYPKFSIHPSIQLSVHPSIHLSIQQMDNEYIL